MSLSVCAVSSGTSAAPTTKNTKTAGFGTRSYRASARPSSPPRRSARSPERATHSSAPIAGPPVDPGGVSVTSDLLRRRDAEDPGRSQEQEQDQDPEDDHILVRGRDV